MKIHRGNTPENAFKILLPKVQKSTYGLTTNNGVIDDFANTQLNEMFGRNDGNYFIYSSETRRTSTKTFKIYLVEDKDGDKHHIFFELV